MQQNIVIQNLKLNKDKEIIIDKSINSFLGISSIFICSKIENFEIKFLKSIYKSGFKIKLTNGINVPILKISNNEFKKIKIIKK